MFAFCVLVGCLHVVSSGMTQAQACIKTKQSSTNPVLCDPSAFSNLPAPNESTASFASNLGSFEVMFHRRISPMHVDRVYNLIKHGFYDGNRFFHVSREQVKFGLHGDPAVSAVWLAASTSLVDKSPPLSTRQTSSLMTGYHYVAMDSNNYYVAMDSSSPTQLILGTGKDRPGVGGNLIVLGEVVRGQDVITSLFNGYGDAPSTQKIVQQGNMYLEENFPLLDFVRTASIQGSNLAFAASPDGTKMAIHKSPDNHGSFLVFSASLLSIFAMAFFFFFQTWLLARLRALIKSFLMSQGKLIVHHASNTLLNKAAAFPTAPQEGKLSTAHQPHTGDHGHSGHHVSPEPSDKAEATTHKMASDDSDSDHQTDSDHDLALRTQDRLRQGKQRRWRVEPKIIQTMNPLLNTRIKNAHTIRRNALTNPAEKYL
eukprot:g67339.t1